MSCNNGYSGLYVPPFIGFTEFTPEVPKLYWDVKSQEQRVLALSKQFHKMICYASFMGEKINANREDIDELVEMFNEFKESGFVDYYEAQLNAWIAEHMPDIIETYVKQVFFGLTLDGYFVAYIPENGAWDDVMFDTGQIYDLDTYGRLMLYYVTDSSSDVWQDQTAANSNMQNAINNLSLRVSANENDIDDLDTRLDTAETAINSPITEGDL